MQTLDLTLVGLTEEEVVAMKDWVDWDNEVNTNKGIISVIINRLNNKLIANERVDAKDFAHNDLIGLAFLYLY